ncbi:isoleucine--tRNA ligase [Listeria ivanovii]|uniref:Isoleucine--tRNA ligase n=2 Tax=Listeria ivanovii TaxID=1638 RepID=A0ABS1G892_LISIV|nr:isoleucine--tRNA ligase [Listeria ivanovii]AIS60421.1 isoleucine--tRNA ligase [Listeria ivanovii subsp. londoniensis]AIS63246.1 isoleucine--tRNA ligase [Listeria ivanovii subsp. londoniensis]MBK1963122.1 isoleucine--tRNA ligase [Listeria ivanovii subsp. londoniensis]MBK1967600.1 isoleucine--tRNA ligase [Listeria ivanovii subsp. londoniensis]MBK1985808.1 isoleucine--tRNA ligase [Listeria ivanovii subsp. londoniensis]
MEYKDTLLMPKTDFPMRGNLPNKEPEWQAKWEEEKLYEKIQEKNAGRPSYILHDGPPYANGELHMGHALNKTIKDIIVRYKSMAGFRSPYVPGWDTHGLPIETAIAKKGVKRKEMSVAEFRKLCAEYAMTQVEGQRTGFKRLGISGDWENPYITLLPEYEAEQIKVFGEMAKKGYIYKGKKPVYWSPSSESALAEAEIEYQDKKSASIFVAFKVTDGKDVLEPGTNIVIWTTTPWTIPANMGITVNPDLDYVVLESAGEKYVVAEALLPSLREKLGFEDAVVLKTVRGSELDRVVTKHPFYDRDSLVMNGEHATAEAGTGAVHTAPGHGEDDFLIGKKYNLEVLAPLDDRGVFTDEAPGFEGVFYDTANKMVTEKLEEVGALLKLEFITHSYPHDWRTKKPVIFRATSQWFASIDAFRDDLLEAVKSVNWTPAWGETRLFNMVRDRGDWVISRQRAWGVPLPIFYAENGEAIITDETISHISELFREHGSNVWFERDVKDLLPDGFTHPGSPNGEFTKETDIMDVWFDSGSSHQAVLNARPELSRPADLYMEGSDQYRGWFNSSLTTAVAVTGESPYRNVLSHGFALDGEGRKMSKSLGNTILPGKVIKQLGADIVRLWVASVDYQADVRVSDEILKQVSEVYRKIRNTMRFLLGNINDFEPTTDSVSYENLREVDKYMLIKLNDLVKNVKDSYEAFEFSTIYHQINNFCTVELSQFYMDFAKDVVYIEATDSPNRRAMQTVFYESVVTLTKLLAPILPHTTEEVWNSLNSEGAESIHLQDLPEVKVLADSENITAKWDAFMQIRDHVQKALEFARNEKLIGKSMLAKVTLYVDGEAKTLFDSLEGDFAQLFIVSDFELVEGLENAPESALKANQVAVQITVAKGETCERCRVVKKDVGADPNHPTLCGRCADIVVKNYEA